MAKSDVPLDTEVVITWVTFDNLRPFLVSCLGLVDYTLEEYEWDAIRFGTKEAKFEGDSGYTYDFEGTERVSFRFSDREELDFVHVVISCQESLLNKLQAFSAIFQYYRAEQGLSSLVPLIHHAFFDTKMLVDYNVVQLTPYQRLDGSGEAYDCFVGKTGQSVLAEDPKISFYIAGINWLTEDAKKYFLPAYAISAILLNDVEDIKYALGSLDELYALDSLDELNRDLPVLQSTILEFLISDLKRRRSMS